jgi:hypothetical protein
MLTPKAQLRLRNAKDYFREHLGAGEYDAAGKQVAGEWFGLGAEKLGLQGKVGEAELLRLSEGLHLTTGERLTQRMNEPPERRRRNRGESSRVLRLHHQSAEVGLGRRVFGG